MKIIELRSATDAELINQFERLAISHRELRNVKEANQAFAASLAVWGEIRRRGQGAIEIFLQLLDSDNPVVRLAAAAKVLFIASERAEPVLEKLTKDKSMLGFSAEMTLREWRAGRLSPQSDE